MERKKEILFCLMVLFTIQISAQNIINKQMLSGLTETQKGILLWYNQKVGQEDSIGQGMLLLIADEFRDATKKNVHTPTSNNNIADKSSEMLHNTADQIKQYWKSHTLSAMSEDYLKLILQDLTPYENDEEIQTIYKDLSVMIDCIQSYNSIIKALNGTYDKAAVVSCYNKVNSLHKIINDENWKTKYGDAHWKELYYDKYAHLACYPDAVKLFQEIISTVNADENVELGRRMADSPTIINAAANIINQKNNKPFKQTDGKTDSRGDKITRYILGIPYLAAKYNEYCNGLMSNPINRNITLEEEILNMKIK